MRLSEVLVENLGIFRRKIPDKRCYQPRGEAESLQGVVRLKGASSDGTNLRVGEGSASISFEKQKQCK